MNDSKTYHCPYCGQTTSVYVNKWIKDGGPSCFDADCPGEAAP